MQFIDTIKESRLLQNKRLAVLAVLIIVITLFFAFPSSAQAGIIEDAIAAIQAMITELLDTASLALLNNGVDVLEGISATAAITSPMSDLFGTGGTSPVYTFVKTIADTIIKPVGHSILGLVMLLQLIKISQKSDSSDVLPGLKDIVFLMLFYALFLLLITYAADVCYLIYTAINTIIIDIQALFTASSYTFTVDTLTSADPGAAFVSLLMAVVFYLISCVAWIVSMFVAYARAIQIYVMTAFSPLPYALLGFDETRSWGVGYIKMFLSLCFAGAIMIILLFVYPMILAGIFGAGSSGAIAINGAEAFDILKLLVVSILLIISLAKSGAWARDIFGG